MENSAKKVVEKMFEAFASGNVDRILETVSEDTVWIYHGTQVIPKDEYRGKEGARQFFNNILNGTEVIKFQPEQFIVEGKMVVVLGNEHQKVKRSGRELKQKWVQVYTIENNLIVRMEEFATTES
ncbi:MAG TPA: nuclear transport factor 2 family protein [Hanamia sp.]|jgi:ketosteroid isomerase-like protein|nr:nuclear transport factor 2 family protein [Hanamia sp.]